MEPLALTVKVYKKSTFLTDEIQVLQKSTADLKSKYNTITQENIALKKQVKSVIDESMILKERLRKMEQSLPEPHTRTYSYQKQREVESLFQKRFDLANCKFCIYFSMLLSSLLCCSVISLLCVCRYL